MLNYLNDLEEELDYNQEVVPTTTMAPVSEKEAEEYNKALTDIYGDSEEYVQSLIDMYGHTGPLPISLKADYEAFPPGGTAATPGATRMEPKKHYNMGPRGSYATLTTSMEEVNTPLIDRNYNYLKSFAAVGNTLDYNYANSIFSAIGKLPVVNGQTITLDKLQEAMNDPKKKDQIMKTATKYHDLPEVASNWELNWDLAINTINHQMVNERIKDGRTIMSNDLKYVAQQLDAKAKTENDTRNYTRSQVMFNEDGSMATYNQYVQNCYKARADYIKKLTESETWNFNNPNYQVSNNKQNFLGSNYSLPSYNSAYYTGQARSDMNSWMPGKYLVNINTGQREYHPANSNPMGWSPEEIDRQKVANIKTASLTRYPANREEYAYFLTEIRNSYNNDKTRGPNYVKALFQKADNPFNKLQGNRGQLTQTVPASMEYNLKGSVNEDGEWPDEVKEFSNLISIGASEKHRSSIIYDVGGIKGEKPENNSGIQTFFKDAYYELGKNHEKGSTYLPTGSIKFQNIALGDVNQYAFNIKFDIDFLKHFKGTKDDKGPLYDIFQDEAKLNELKDNGVTIYVPRSIAEGTYKKYNPDTRTEEKIMNSIIGGYSKRARELSTYEAQFQRRNKIEFTIPNAGNRVIIRNNDNSVTITGYDLVYNHNTNKYEKDVMKEVKIKGSNYIDVDDLVNKQLSHMKAIYSGNAYRYKGKLNLQNKK